MQLTYDEIMGMLDITYNAGSNFGYTLSPGVYELSDINLMLKSSLSNGVEVNVTFDDIRLISNFTTNATLRFTEKSFFLHKLKFRSITPRSFERSPSRVPSEDIRNFQKPKTE